jgi:lipoyl(octanoyl) transferase
MHIRSLGRCEYRAVETAMREFTHTRAADTPDEIWLVEHEPVFTLGVAGRDQHVLDAGAIPVLRTDRGGQVTYHGPGQLVAYPLIDLRRLRIYVKEYVYRLEQAVLDVLRAHGLTGHRVPGAPGVFVCIDDPAGHARHVADAADLFAGLAKVAALGVKVSNHRTYHGVALNVSMDLRPFSRINPCGYAWLESIDLATLGIDARWDTVAESLAARLTALLSP